MKPAAPAGDQFTGPFSDLPGGDGAATAPPDGPDGRPQAKCPCKAGAQAGAFGAGPDFAPDLGQPGGPEPGTETAPAPARRHAKVPAQAARPGPATTPAAGEVPPHKTITDMEAGPRRTSQWAARASSAPRPDPGAPTAPGAEGTPDVAGAEADAAAANGQKRSAVRRAAAQPPPPADDGTDNGKPGPPVVKSFVSPGEAATARHRDFNSGKAEPLFTAKGLVSHPRDTRAEGDEPKQGEHRDRNTDDKEPKVPAGEIRGPWMEEARKDLARLRAAGGSLPGSISHLPAKWLANGGRGSANVVKDLSDVLAKLASGEVVGSSSSVGGKGDKDSVLSVSVSPDGYSNAYGGQAQSRLRELDAGRHWQGGKFSGFGRRNS
jgi:hypothetical protein